MIPDVGWVDVLVRLAVAAALTGAIGMERELRERAAGLRTHMLVALGAALVIIAAQQSGMDSEALSRVVQGIFAGIGFLGAGAIIKLNEQERIKALERENRELRQANEILRKASAYFAQAELDRPFRK